MKAFLEILITGGVGAMCTLQLWLAVTKQQVWGGQFKRFDRRTSPIIFWINVFGATVLLVFCGILIGFFATGRPFPAWAKAEWTISF